MNTNRRWKINQIIPAQTGWKAVHCAESASGEVTMFNRAIICWALVEEIGESDAGRTQVRGMEQNFDNLIVVDDIITAETLPPDSLNGNQYFIGYDDPDSHRESEYWIAEANRRLRNEREQRSK
jgi:hypothetical protein